MNLPFHLFGLAPTPSQGGGDTLRLVGRGDVQWDRPVFRAPALPAANPVSGEMPLFVNFSSKRPRRR
jgi:hypothetical protein